VSAAVVLPRSIGVGDLGRLMAVGARLGGVRVIIVPEDDIHAAVAKIARRMEKIHGSAVIRVENPTDAQALAQRVRDASDAVLIISGLEGFTDEDWRRLDLLRSRLLRRAPTLLTLSSRAMERLAQLAPNLASVVAPLWRLEGAADASEDVEGDVAAQEEFDQLAKRWIEDTRLTSSVTKMVNHSAYKAIIAMGDRAVPPILRDLEREPKMWGPALHAITGAAPVPKEDAGRVARVATAWLRWAKANGYEW
jgi:hypothetical protein